ncbi:hypothetical protein RRG08_021936 [Elysia crispata]|uniref:Uncharacterized protein n=1 Tax=Elysia crispata TaxID=231223 RepID=A0AAE1ADA1_9GAST|nr:hypothetical protein RRG08_021936 [Elysia crispata]
MTHGKCSDPASRSELTRENATSALMLKQDLSILILRVQCACGARLAIIVPYNRTLILIPARFHYSMRQEDCFPPGQLLAVSSPVTMDQRSSKLWYRFGGTDIDSQQVLLTL